MTTRIATMARRPLALAMIVALMAPGVALAQSKKEKALEARVAQLEAQVQQLLSAQQQTQAQVVQTQSQVSQTQTQVADTKTQLDQVKATAAAKPAAPQFTTAPGMSVAFHGFVNATAFEQSRPFNFGNGQNAEWPTPGGKGDLSGVDIRNTRFWVDITGAKMGEHWTGGARLEMDFFGGNNGTGAYSGQQPVPRLRQAYLDMDNAATGTKVRVGQQWTLMFPLDNVPDSVAHVAFPLGFGTGMIGWRYPGVVVMQDLNHGSEGPKWRLDVGAFSGNWSGPGSTTNYLTGGNAGFNPQVEARVRVAGSNWVAYAAGHYSKIDLSGVDGATPTPIRSDIKSTAFEVGGMVKPGNWNIKAFAFTGNGMGQNFGALSQFGDISETGGYAQVGYSFNKNWSLNAFYAVDNPDKDDVLRWRGTAVGLLNNRQTALNLIYANGPYKLGLEAMHDKLEHTVGTTANTTTESGNQVSVSAQYTF